MDILRFAYPFKLLKNTLDLVNGDGALIRRDDAVRPSGQLYIIIFTGDYVVNGNFGMILGTLP